ncbi:hypothetical protein [uncultured Cocleimonas sp.]|uniref:hypothetical protein n=1 Tax=uncultured Cocleimonas sp. TaxID=1051587 RepID=UPI002603EC5B|nr:hypothetical protein [uncultured Cocleimonas sp.]
MNTKAIIAATLLTALVAGQSAIAGQDTDNGVFATAAASESTMVQKVNYQAPSFEVEEMTVSGRK